MMVGGYRVAWLPGLGTSPGGVDLIAVGPDGGMTMRAVTLGDATGLAALLSLTTGCSDLLNDLAQIVAKGTSQNVASAGQPISVGSSEAS
jgi:hypothetical protein